MFLLDIIKQQRNKKEAASIVASAETIGYETGLNAIDIINRYEKDNIYLKEIKMLYAQNKPKHVIYSKIFDKQFLFILNACEKKGLLVGEIFKDYMEIKEKIEVAKNKIVSAIIYPFLSYVLSAIIVFIVLMQMNTQLKSLKFLKTPFVETTLYFYWPIIIGIGFILLFPLLKYPRVVPFLKNAYKELDAFQYVSSIHFILKSGLSMVDVYEVFKDKIKVNKKDIEGIISFLEKFLNPTEIYAIRIAVQTFKFDVIFKSILNSRRNEFETKINKITSTISTLLTMIVAIPAAIMLYTMFKLYTIVSQASKTGGGF